MMRKKIIFLVIDQLAGHWADNVLIENTGLPPVNIEGYHKLGLIPNFSYLINNGLWVKRAWNRGVCDTRHGMRYLATGRYARPLYNEYFWRNRRDYSDEELIGFFEYAKDYYGVELKCAVFSGWYQRGYFYIPDLIVCPHCTTIKLDNSILWSDYLLWRNFVKPYIETNPGFNLMHIYFPTFDTINYCPSYYEKATNFFSSKHHYLLLLDSIIGDMIDFLKARKIWNNIYFIIASDHGYHLGCSIARKMGVKTNNWCCGHDFPFDCMVWDFKEDRSTNVYSGGPRRITFILSGGGLEEEFRGKYIDEAEIIDVIPTIADVLDIPYKCEGKSILKMNMKSQDNIIKEKFDKNSKIT